MKPSTVSLERALEETRTGDIWLFRGHSGPDRAIQSMTNSPVNHVGMTVALEDLPPLIWHAELGDKLLDLWTGTHHRGVQLNDLRAAVHRWADAYGQRCWLRQLTPHADREQEDRMLTVIARMDGTPFPSTARLTGRWLRGRIPTVSDFTRGIPLVHKAVRRAADKRKIERTQMGLETPTARRPWRSPTRRWACSSPRRTRTGSIRDRSGVVMTCRWPTATDWAPRSRFAP